MQVIQRKPTPESSFLLLFLLLLLPFFRCPLPQLWILSRYSKSSFLKKMCFKNSLGYLQSGLCSHPTMCCHITAIDSCSACWWLGLGFPFHSAANPLEVKHAVVGDLSLYYKKINNVSHLPPVWLQQFQLGWAWVRREVLLLGWQLWRLAGVVSPANGAHICSSHCGDPAPSPAVKCRVRGSAPATGHTPPGDGQAGICVWSCDH